MTRAARHGGRPRGAYRTGNQDRWLLSYADLITLMFAFFTVMYAVSTVDARKVAPAASSMQQAFSMAATERAPVPASEPAPAAAVPVPAAPAASADGDLDGVRQRLSLELSDAIESGRLEIAEDPRGLVLSLPVEATFATGSADVQPEARLLIARIAASMQPLDNALRIEGHTDDVPIRTPRYESNWELSTARASAVVSFLIDDAGVRPARLSAAGYGEFHPRAPNDSAGNRARNRRVAIVVLNQTTAREEPGGRTPGAGTGNRGTDASAGVER